MRALLIGVGKAGCRIVNKLADHDSKSGVTSVRSYVFDPDQEFLSSMEAIDPDKRILLSPKGVERESCRFGTDFDLTNIPGYFDDSIVDQADAVFVCAGLGGKMGEALPSIIAQLNTVFTDPVFAILTIPARNEGARVSARAAAELEAIRQVASAEIIFDNETWVVRLEEEHAAKLAESKEIKGEDGIVIREASKLAVSEVQNELNELLTRRIELLLRAGEITENGIETAEAVLDAGEVLNTLTDSDIVSIGYAAEVLPRKLLGFLNRFRMEKYFLEEGHKRTARIVNLAKKAVYEEVSVPCDLTTADKALVLITGPSNELSMKGFQTIRKWIDNSIKGLEMRAGDYPIKSTKDVGVVIVLAGIENVPRIAELNEIRASYDEEVKKKYQTREDLFDEERNPGIRSASDNEIFEEGEVISIGAGTPMLQGYEANLGYATAAMMGTATVTATAYAGYRVADSSQSGYENDVIYPEDSDIGFEEVDEYLDSEEEYNEVDRTFEEESYGATDDATIEDDEIFDDGEYAEEYIPENPDEESNTDDDFFDETIPEDIADVQHSELPLLKDEEEEEDVFEDNPVRIAHEIPVEPIVTTAGAAVIGAVAVDELISSKEKRKTTKRKSDPQITLAGKKKKKTELDSAIPLPKRNKQPDMVLSGQADLGERKVLKEGMDRSSISSRKLPKETDGDVSIGSGQRPKETDGDVSIGFGQRPKEIDGAVSIGSGQRPKEIDGAVSVGTKRKPKDGGRAVSVGTKMKPNDAGRAVSVGTKMKPNDAGRAVSVGTKMKPNDAGRAVSVGTKMKPNDAGRAVSVGTKQTPKEIGNVVKVVEKKPLKTDVWKTIREAQQKRESPGEKSSGTSRNLKWM